jgi:hypothetical protein
MSIAKVGEYRIIVPKKGVYIPMKKMASGKMKAKYLHRTKARVAATGKRSVQKIVTRKAHTRQIGRTLHSGIKFVPVKQHPMRLSKKKKYNIVDLMFFDASPAKQKLYKAVIKRAQRRLK